MLIPDKFVITVEPIVITININITNDRDDAEAQKIIDDETAKLNQAADKLENAEKV